MEAFLSGLATRAEVEGLVDRIPRQVGDTRHTSRLEPLHQVQRLAEEEGAAEAGSDAQVHSRVADIANSTGDNGSAGPALSMYYFALHRRDFGKLTENQFTRSQLRLCAPSR